MSIIDSLVFEKVSFVVAFLVSLVYEVTNY